MRDEELNPGFGGYNPNPGFGNSYPSGNNPIGGNIPYNPNTNNNGFPNPNPSFGSSGSSGNNQWGNRGKRDLSNWDLSKEAGSEIKNSQEKPENQDYDGTGTSSQEHDDYGSKEEPEKSETNKLNHSADPDVDIISNVSSENLPKSARQMAAEQKNWKRTRRPVETGVVYTKWGNVAAGRVIAGAWLLLYDII